MWSLADDIAKTSDKILTFGPSKCTGCAWSCLGIKIGDSPLSEEVDASSLSTMRMACFDVDVMLV